MWYRNMVMGRKWCWISLCRFCSLISFFITCDTNVAEGCVVLKFQLQTIMVHYMQNYCCPWEFQIPPRGRSPNAAYTVHTSVITNWNCSTVYCIDIQWIQTDTHNIMSAPLKKLSSAFTYEAMWFFNENDNGKKWCIH